MTTKYEEVLKESFENEYNDCSVIAVSVVCEVSYKEAYDALAKQGRKACEGASDYQITKAIKELKPDYSMERLLPSMQEGMNYKDPTVNQLSKHFKTGKYLCFIKAHVFALVDGEVQDWCEGTRNRVFSMIEIF